MVELPPEISFTLQVTLVEEPSVPVTLAVNTCAPLVGTLAVVGETVTTILDGGGEAELVFPHADSKSTPTQRMIRHRKCGRARMARHAARA